MWRIVTAQTLHFFIFQYLLSPFLLFIWVIESFESMQQKQQEIQLRKKVTFSPFKALPVRYPHGRRDVAQIGQE